MQSEETNISEILKTAKNLPKNKKKVAYIAISFVLLASYFIFSSSDGNSSMKFETAKATKGNLTATVTATGNIKPLKQVEIGSEISGLVREVKVDFNDIVTKNEVIAVLDTDQLEANFAKAKASLELSQAELLDAKASYKETSNKLKRANKLAKKKNISQQYLESAEAEYARANAGVVKAEAKINQAKAELNSAKRNLEKAYIKSPINGIVLSRKVEVGQTVAASLQAPVLFILAEDLSHMQLYVNIDEADIGQVKENQKATFTVDAHPADKFKAEITSVRNSPISEQDIVTYEAVLNVDNSDMLLKPGMTATAEIVTDKIENTLLIPNSSLRFAPPPKNKEKKGLFKMFSRRPHKQKEGKEVLKKNQKKIWLLKDKEPEAIIIDTGLSDGNNTQVLSDNLKNDDVIITGMVRKTK